MKWFQQPPHPPLKKVLNGRYIIIYALIAPLRLSSLPVLTNTLIERTGDNILRWIPMSRIGREDEIKGTVVFLASEASSYITGQVICIDGGTTTW